MINENPSVPDQFKQIKRNKKEGYNLNIMWQFACLIVNPILRYGYNFLIIYTTICQAID